MLRRVDVGLQNPDACEEFVGRPVREETPGLQLALLASL
jgi:hypothetical protein